MGNDMTTYEIQILVRVNLKTEPEQVKMDMADLLAVIKKGFTPKSGTGMIRCEMDESGITIRKL